MASETRPATSRRATESTTRSSAATTMAPATSFSSPRSSLLTASIPRPVSQGSATVATIARPARTIDQIAPAR